GQADGLLAAAGPLTRAALRGDQSAINRPGRTVRPVAQRPLQPDVPCAGAVVPADEVGQARGQDLPQPGRQLRLAGAAERPEVPGGLQERLLNQVYRVRLALKPAAEFQAREQQQVRPVLLQQSTQGPVVPRPCAGEEAFVGTIVVRTHRYL